MITSNEDLFLSDSARVNSKSYTQKCKTAFPFVLSNVLLGHLGGSGGWATDFS